MSVLSKTATDIVGRSCDCSTLFHPRHGNCIVGQFMETPRTLMNNVVFFFIMHAASILQVIYTGNGFIFAMPQAQNYQKRRQINRKTLPAMILDYLRTVAIVTSAVNFYFWSFCILHKLNGRTSYSTLVHWAPLISGLPMIFDTKIRKFLSTMTYSSFAVETLIRRMYLTRDTRNLSVETIWFMLMNALAMHFSTRKIVDKFNFYWFYEPSQHTERMRQSLKYFAYGFAFSSFKVILSRPSLLLKPRLLLLETLKWKNFRMSAFNFIYVYLFNLLSGYSVPLSGLVAGISYRINPSLTVLSTLTAYVAQQILLRVRHACKLPNLPYLDFFFILVNALLVSTSISTPQACPRAYHMFANAFIGPRLRLLDNLHGLSECYRKTL